MLVPLRLSAWMVKMTSLRSKKLRCDFGQERCIMQEWITRRATAQRAIEVWFIRGNLAQSRIDGKLAQADLWREEEPLVGFD